jgi:adenylate cyclase
MENESVSRRLAAILAADIAGYSKLMGADEVATVAALKAHQTAIVPLIAAAGGRVVDLAGDGILAEFQSVVAAVNAAIALQALMAERNAEVPLHRRLQFRVGVNLGDVIYDDARIYGDGINIAARLQAIAEPGGICISGKVYDEVADRLAGPFSDMGERELKNIARPVRVYAVGGKEAAPVRDLGAVLPSLAVLPFQNMSGDPEQDYFADGVVEDIITALSRFKSFAVIARNSSFIYKGRAVDVRDVGRELGVRYVLEGSVRKAGDRLRIAAQLVDAESGGHIWAQNFDGTVDDVFDFQDGITRDVVGRVEPRIRDAEFERSRRERPGSMEAYDLYLRASAKNYTQSAEDNAEADRLLAAALRIEPDNTVYLGLAVQNLQHRGSMAWPPVRPDDERRGRELVARALPLAGDDAETLAYCASALIHVQKDYDRGMDLIRRAVEINPNNLTVVACASVAHLHCGKIADGITFAEHSLRLSPGDLGAHWSLTAISHAHMALGDYEEALVWARKSLNANSRFPCTYWMLVAGNAQLGRLDEARRHLKTLLEMQPELTVAKIHAGQPQQKPDRLAAILEGLRLAGMPEA